MFPNLLPDWKSIVHIDGGSDSVEYANDKNQGPGERR